jgi:hypothetical protein
MGQCEPRERGVKNYFKELQGVRHLRIKIKKGINESCVSPAKLNEPNPKFLSAVCLSCTF